MSEVELLNKLSAAVAAYDEDVAVGLARQALQEGIDPLHLVEGGLTPGIKDVGDRFGRGDLFLPELMGAAKTFKAAMDVVTPMIATRNEGARKKGTILLGTVEGDIHDLGKTIVGILASAYGFQVVDLGHNVKASAFVAKVREIQPDIVGLSALLTTTRLKQREVIQALEKAGVRASVKVIVGGAVTTQGWAAEIGADAYGANATDGVNKMLEMVDV